MALLRRSTGRRMQSRQAWVGFAFVSPALLFMTLAMVWPLLISVKQAFFRIDLNTQEPVFVGFKNFVIFFTNRSLVQSLPTTLVFVLASTAFAFILGLIWALVLEQIRHGRGFLRGITIIPWVLPSVVTAFLWAWMFNGQFGVLNGVGTELGWLQQNVVWLSDPTTAMVAVIAARTWQSLPWFVLMFLAGFQSVPIDLVEAVRVDGGRNWHVLKDVVLPHMRFTMLVAVILGATGNLQLFDLIYAMTGGGPAGTTSVMSLAVYQQAFQIFDFGTASAIGVIWILLMVIPAIIYVRSALPPAQKGH